jgi:hypothetical protein
MPQPARIPSTGRVVTFGGTGLTYVKSAYPKVSNKLQEVANQADALTRRVSGAGEWSVEVDFDFDVITKSLSPVLSVGSFDGAELQKFSLKLDVKVADVAGNHDDWTQKVPTKIDASMSLTRFKTTTSTDAFLAAIKSQIAASGSAHVLCSSGLGSFYALLESSEFGDEDAVLTEGAELKMSLPAFTVGNGVPALALLFSELSAYATALAQGQAPVAKDLVVPEGTGLAYVKALSVDCPEGKVTAKASFEGTGEFA